MYILSSLIHHIETRKQRTQQKRTALQLLTFSGVVRSSHVELRYATPIATISGFGVQRLAIPPPKSLLIPSRSGANNVPALTRLWQRVRRLSSIQLLRGPLQSPGLAREPRYKGAALRLIKGSRHASIPG